MNAEKAVEAYEKAFEIYESIGSDTLAELCRVLITNLEEESS